MSTPWDPMSSPAQAPPLVMTFGRTELVVRRRYEVASIVNDVLVAVWFLLGSILFFSPETTYAGTWLFVLGSVELMIRPLLRLSRRVHLGRIRDARSPGDAEGDF